jgi:hypothetical protein
MTDVGRARGDDGDGDSSLLIYLSIPRFDLPPRRVPFPIFSGLACGANLVPHCSNFVLDPRIQNSPNQYPLKGIATLISHAAQGGSAQMGIGSIYP